MVEQIKSDYNESKIKERKNDVLNCLNAYLNQKCGSPLPGVYTAFLFNASTSRIGNYLFFGLFKKIGTNPIKEVKYLMRKQNGDRACYPIYAPVLPRRKNKKRKAKTDRINRPFCIATTIDYSCGYYIDLKHPRSQNKATFPVYKCSEDGKIKICARSIDVFLARCKRIEAQTARVGTKKVS